MIRCIIDNIEHIMDEGRKCVLCDKQFCCCSKSHGLAKYKVQSDNGACHNFICGQEIERYKERGWKIMEVIDGK